MTPNDRDNNICEICAVLVGWVTSVVLSVSMKMGYIYSLVWYTHNNQLYWYEDGGSTRSNDTHGCHSGSIA